MELKEQGNAAVRTMDFTAAGDAYTRAISLLNGMPRSAEVDATAAVVFHNRAVVRMRQERWQDALVDADAAILRKPNYAKAFSTRGAALQHLNRLPDAIESFRLG